MLQFLSIALFIVTFTHADEGVAPSFENNEFVFEDVHSSGDVDDIVWSTKKPTVSVSAFGGRNIPCLLLRGQSVSAKGNSILYSIKGIQNISRVDEDGEFTLLIPLRNENISTTLTLIDDYGKTHRARITLKLRISEKMRKLLVDVGTQFSYLNYTEHSFAKDFKLTEFAIGAKANIGYRFNPKWDVSVNAFVTALPLTSSSSPAGLKPARWYGINSRVGYAIKQDEMRNRYTIAFGWYSWGMLTSDDVPEKEYGVESLGGPQLFFIKRGVTAEGRSYYGYLKGALVGSTEGFGLSNNELAIGGGYQPWLSSANSRLWMVTVDVAHTETEVFNLLSVSSGIARQF